jgi:hypothetical protein
MPIVRILVVLLALASPALAQDGAREEALAGLRSVTAEFILEAICSVSGSKPANAGLVAAAIRDTREVWASFFLPQDRACVIEYLAGPPGLMPDATARADLAAFTAALQGVN